MAIIVQLTFPAGRYHATPWGRHVNEGVAEWPPSPWRLLRALVAVWKRTAPEISEAQVRRILEAMIEPPMFSLPHYRVAHTRHYMPWEKKGPQDRTLVFDTFVSISRKATVSMGWLDVELTADDRAVLSRLLSNMTSLGRAEGWVNAQLSEQHPTWNCQPASVEANPVQVFCADPLSVFDDTHFPKLDPKKLSKGKINPSEFLFDSPRWHLCLDTETIHKERWPTAPGTCWVNYTRPQEGINQSSRTQPKSRPTVARFLLDGPVLPLVTDTILVAEMFRSALMSMFSKVCEHDPVLAERHRREDRPDLIASENFSGKGTNGAMTLNHQHAYFLPTCESAAQRHRITHVTVISESGFSQEEVAALSNLKRLHFHQEQLRLRVQKIGMGQPDDFEHPLFQQSRTWICITPFLGPMHIGKYQQERFLRKAARKAVRRMIEKHLLPIDAELESISILPHQPRAIEFRRSRSTTKRDGAYRAGAFMKLKFQAPVSRPSAFGFASHFGMGLLWPE